MRHSQITQAHCHFPSTLSPVLLVKYLKYLWWIISLTLQDLFQISAAQTSPLSLGTDIYYFLIKLRSTNLNPINSFLPIYLPPFIH